MRGWLKMSEISSSNFWRVAAVKSDLARIGTTKAPAPPITQLL
jgi:hypothetical protein